MDIPGLLINYIKKIKLSNILDYVEDSFISCKISIKVVNWIKIYSYWYTWIICSSEIFQTTNQLDSSFDNFSIFKRNLSDNLLVIFIKTSRNRKSSVAATFGRIFWMRKYGWENKQILANCCW